jgi:hypothetical protein
MSVPLVVLGITYNYPVQGDVNWGPVLTAWSTAVTNALAPFYNGSTLTITSQAANPATAGLLRLANTDTIDFRNFANTGNLALAVNASNQLTFNGTPIGASAALTNGHIFVGNVSNQPADVAMSGDVTITNTGVTAISAGVIVNANINAAAAIAVSKLAALTASRAVVTDGSGFLSAATTTATEIGFVNGVTSSIQTQLNTLTTNQGNYLPLAGGTMSGAINMGSNKITSLTFGTNNGEALAYGQGFSTGGNKITNLAAPTTAGDAVRFENLPAPATYTPTVVGAGTISNANGFFSVSGKTVHMWGSFQAGTTTATTATITIPGTAALDPTKTTIYVPLGTSSAITTGAAFNANNTVMLYDGTATNTLSFSKTGTSGAGFTLALGNTIWNNNEFVWFDAWVPTV